MALFLMSATDSSDVPMLGRIVRPADYARVLAAPLRLRSPHFAVHHLEGRPLPPGNACARCHVLVKKWSACSRTRPSQSRIASAWRRPSSTSVSERVPVTSLAVFALDLA